MSRVSTRKHKPLYCRVWLVTLLLLLAVAWTVGTFLPTRSQDGLVPAHQSWILMGTILEATVYRPATATTLVRADLEAVHNAVFKIAQPMSLYRPESELVALNAQAGAGQIKVSAATLRPAVEGTEPSSLSECVWPIGLEVEKEPPEPRKGLKRSCSFHEVADSLARIMHGLS